MEGMLTDAAKLPFEDYQVSCFYLCISLLKLARLIVRVACLG